MCGIAGLLGFKDIGEQEKLNRLENMGESIAHRGPDGAGFWVDDGVAFVHRRLSIIGISTGAQPMHSSCGGCALIFNGEIYNYKELRDKLKISGYQFKTESDTEVILALYVTEGISGFSKMRGMFAFALWDSIRKLAYLVRDPSGIKPLFYRISQAGVEFGSEAKAILASDSRDTSLSEVALHKLMNFRYLPDDKSLFSRIYQIPPGAIFCWKRNHFGEVAKVSYPELKKDIGILEALDDSVSFHTRADVEIGAYLSGGLDSAIVSALAARHVPYKLCSFTLDVGDNPMEAVYAKQTADEVGLVNLLAPMKFESNYWVKLIGNLEVPKVNALQIGLIAKHASQHVKVSLSGLGGDEIFLGYNAHGWMSKSHVLHLHASSLSRFLGSFGHHLFRLCANQFWSEKERTLLIAKNISKPSTVYGLFRNVWDSPSARKVIYGPRMLDADLPNVFDWLEAEWPQNNDPVLSMRDFEWDRKMVNDLLWQEDRCSMAHGLEVRVPFVDPLVKLSAWNLPRSELMRNGEKKGLLKEVVRPVLSDQIINRKKSGFQVDAPSFFRSELTALARQYLSTDVVKRIGLFNPNFIERVLQLNAEKQNRWHYFMLYLMLSTHIWIDVFEGNKVVKP